MLGSSWRMPQGVRGRIFWKIQSWGKHIRIYTFEGAKGRQKAKYLEVLKESVVTRNRRRTSSAERDTLVSCAEVLREKNGWSKFSKENSWNPVSRQISWKRKGVTASIPKGSKIKRSRNVDPSHKGRWIYTWIPISGLHRWKSYKLCNRNHDIWNHEAPKAKRIVWVTEETSGGQVAHSQQGSQFSWPFRGLGEWSSQFLALEFVILRSPKSR